MMGAQLELAIAVVVPATHRTSKADRERLAAELAELDRQRLVERRADEDRYRRDCEPHAEPYDVGEADGRVFAVDETDGHAADIELSEWIRGQRRAKGFRAEVHRDGAPTPSSGWAPGYPLQIEGRWSTP